MNETNVTEKNKSTNDPTIARFERLESKIVNQRKTNRLLTLALLVSISLGASNFEWVKKAWAAGTAVLMDPNTYTYSGAVFQATNQSTSGSAIGVKGESTESGTGVWGKSAGGNGVIGQVTNPTYSGKSGVYGTNDSTSIGGYGVYGIAKASEGLKSVGVYGYQNGTATTATTYAAGVLGESVNAYGVKAFSTNNNGLYASSASAPGGVFASSDTNSGQIKLIPKSGGIGPGGYCNPSRDGEIAAINSTNSSFLLFCKGGTWMEIEMH